MNSRSKSSASMRLFCIIMPETRWRCSSPVSTSVGMRACGLNGTQPGDVHPPARPTIDARAPRNMCRLHFMIVSPLGRGKPCRLISEARPGAAHMDQNHRLGPWSVNRGGGPNLSAASRLNLRAVGVLYEPRPRGGGPALTSKTTHDATPPRFGARTGPTRARDHALAVDPMRYRPLAGSMRA